MSKKVAVIIKDKSRQYEGIRSSLGLLLENHTVSMIVLDNEIDLSEEYLENMQFIDEMGGARFSNVPENIANHGFKPVSLVSMGTLLKENEIIIPF